MAEIPDVVGDGFWLDFFIAELTSTLNTPSKYEQSHIETAIKLGIVKANNDLAAVKTFILSKDFSDFSVFNLTIAESLDDMPVTEFYYRMAVQFWAKLQLLRSAPGLGRSVTAEKAADLDNEMATWLEDNYYQMIGLLVEKVKTIYADFTGESSSNVSVALI